MNDFHSYMGVAKVISDPDGKPIQLTGSGFEITEVAKQLGVAALSTVLLLPVGTGTNRESICPILGPGPGFTWTVKEKLALPECIAFCRTHLSLNMTQLATALRRERQTLYGWISGTSFPHAASERRLETISRIAADWHRYAGFPVGKAVTRKLSNGVSLCDMLAAPEIDAFEIRSLFPELKQLAAVKSRGEERRELAEALGYEKQSKADLAAQLRRNLAI